MLSRAQKLEQLYILGDLHVSKWKASPSALQELRRLETNALNSKGIGKFQIASLNVRSLPKHFEDIKTLINFQVDVICLQDDSGQYQCDPSASYPQHVNVHVIDTGTDEVTMPCRMLLQVLKNVIL